MDNREQKFVLSNGVRVLIEEIPHVRSASVGFWVDAGTKDESPANNGISHFIEHMMFKGTAKRSALDIARSLEDTGGSLNAFTDKENTCYYARVLDDQVSLAIDVLSDMLMNAAMDPAELKREKQVVIEEIKMYEDQPDELVQDMFSEAFWGNHPLGRPIVGTRQTVRATRREDIFAYLDRNYSPDRIIVSIAGNIRTTEVLEQLEATIGQLSRPGESRLLTGPECLSNIKVKYKDIEQVHLCLGTPGLVATDPDRYVLALIDSILGGGMSSRLFQEVREKRGLAYSISSYEIMYAKAGVFGVYAGCSPKHADSVVDLVVEELEKVKADGFTEEELRRAKDQLRGGMLLAMETPRHRMSRMARNELYFGRLISPDEVVADMEAVTLADIQRVASQLFDTRRLTMTVVGPVRKLKAASLQQAS
jgi:predicted Zn-dependent peptidase